MLSGILISAFILFLSVFPDYYKDSTPPKLWDRGIIHYEYAKGITPYCREKIRYSMAQWSEATDDTVIFLPKVNWKPHITFVPGNGYSAYLGMPYWNSRVKIDKEVCGIRGIKHELGHVIGLIHEHERPDRDQYIDIKWENIREGKFHNFYGHTAEGYPILGPYDYFSIMHYSSRAFTKNGHLTITSKEAIYYSFYHKDFYIRNNFHISELDVEKVKALYSSRFANFFE
ncbi:MAG: hypothetical protein DRN81_02360 [Thermoproteota archaeon]|nr:MAG: hypothetical protein DRN81_02360 [Candidatus Korarchaeota archaeon]